MTVERLKLSGPNGCYQQPPALTTTTLLTKGPVMATADSTVTYKDIPGFPGYRVGDDGSVWSLVMRKHPPEWRRKAVVIPNCGRAAVHLWNNGSRRSMSVHRLVLLAFVGECPDGMECCHNDGNCLNNAISNLRWDTRDSNVKDKINHGAQPRGSKHGHAKLTEEIVAKARAEYARGATIRGLARKYGVAEAPMRAALKRKTWSHVA